MLYMSGYKNLTDKFLKEFRKLNYATVAEWCKPFLGNDFPLKFSTMDELFNILESSSVFNFLYPKPLKYLGIKSGIRNLIDAVRNYEETHLSRKLQDILLMLKEIKVEGKNLSEEDSKSVIPALLEQEITISQLQHIFIPRLSRDKVLTLDCGSHSVKFYHSYKVGTRY